MAIRSILIALPAYGASIKTVCVESLLKLQHALDQKGIEIAYRIVNAPDIIGVRNFFGSLLLENSGLDALLFIDSDMKFEPSDIFRLLDSGKPMIGCVYPMKTEAPAFVVIPLNGKEIIINQDGIGKVDVIGMGVTVIHREVFETLRPHVRTYTIHSYSNLGLAGPLCGFFDPFQIEGTYLVEDTSLCHRWRETGGDVWALFDCTIGHVGDRTWSGNYLQYLKDRRQPL